MPDTLAAMQNGKWHWGLGDPHPLAIAVTLLYFIVAVTSAVAARHVSPHIHDNYTNEVTERRLWMSIAIGMALLGINKQTDFQTLIALVGRDLLTRVGLYDQRRVIQFWFIIAVAIVAVVLAATSARMLLRQSRSNKTAVCGIVVLLGFIVARAASFHHFDRMLGIQLGNISVNLVIEASALLQILWAAIARTAGQTQNNLP
jgi:hypothetical protein